jgi:hypothetical protein
VQKENLQITRLGGLKIKTRNTGNWPYMFPK